MRPDDAIGAQIERLLGEMLVHFRAIGGNAHNRRHARGDRARAGDFAAVHHVLQRVAHVGAVPDVVLRLEHDAVVFRAMQRNRGVGGGGREGRERGLAGFERADDVIEAGDISHIHTIELIGLLEAGQPF